MADRPDNPAPAHTTTEPPQSDMSTEKYGDDWLLTKSQFAEINRHYDALTDPEDKGTYESILNNMKNLALNCTAIANSAFSLNPMAAFQVQEGDLRGVLSTIYDPKKAATIATEIANMYRQVAGIAIADPAFVDPASGFAGRVNAGRAPVGNADEKRLAAIREEVKGPFIKATNEQRERDRTKTTAWGTPEREFDYTFNTAFIKQLKWAASRLDNTGSWELGIQAGMELFTLAGYSEDAAKSLVTEIADMIRPKEASIKIT
jgi:hypothetical protein